jgi:glucose uptake protein
MFIPQYYSLAIILCVISMICMGSWASTQKSLEKVWRFELFYWDFVIGIFLFSILLAFTMGSSGESGRGFLLDLEQATPGNMFNAFLGGVIFNSANIMLVAAMTIAGMSVAFPVGLGLAFILGVIINYFTVPFGNALLLFGGMALIVIAIIIISIAYKKHSLIKKRISGKGLSLSILSGILMSLYFRFVASSMVTNFELPEAGKLTPYTAIFLFSVGVLLSNVFVNFYMMRKPIVGRPLTFKDYTKGKFDIHLTSVLGGVIWNIGMSLSILASGKAGSAISYGLGQGATLIAVLWGIFIWKEFKGATKSVNSLIVLMFLVYLAGLVLIVYAGK